MAIFLFVWEKFIKDIILEIIMGIENKVYRGKTQTKRHFSGFQHKKKTVYLLMINMR